MGFAETFLAASRLKLAHQQAVERNKIESQALKLREKIFNLRQQQVQQDMEETARQRQLAQTLQRGRSEAGAAASALLDPSLNLDEQAQGELQGIVTRQQAQEGNFQPIQKLLQMRDDMGRRRELAQSLDALLTDLPGPQAAFGRAALRAYTGGQLDDNNLFRFFDRLSGGQGPTSMLSLAFIAAGQGPRAAQARRALQLLPDEQHNMTATHLSWLAQQGGEVGKQAQAALDALKQLRSTGVRSRKRGRRIQEEPPSPFLQPQQTPLPGGGVQGTGRPKVKSFKRVK